jgi:tetratricopeptide (TPR) repeat protein
LRAELADRGGGMFGVMSAVAALHIELLAGDPAAAVPLGQELYRLHEKLGLQGYLSWSAGTLAQTYYALGRLEDADAWGGRAAELQPSDDPETLGRQARAKVLARRGEHAEAERLAREAIDINDATDMLDAQGDAYTDLAEVLALGGRPERAVEALEQALTRYERKENLVMADRVRVRLSKLQSSDTPAPTTRPS